MSTGATRPEPGRDRAAELFAAFAAEHSPDDERSFEDLCRAHPRLSWGLREARAAWLEVNSVLLRDGAPGTLDDAPSILSEVARIARRIRGPEQAARLVRRLTERTSSGERYREEGELGRGAMGVVLAAWDEDLNRVVAMKRVQGPNTLEGSDLQRRRVERFLEEAQVTGQLQHPGIVPVHELGHDADGRLFFTMKRVEGETLATVFRKAQTGADGWTTTRVVVQLLKVCEAMDYAHSKGVLHRDLKPANVMVGRYGEVHVMDWGLARVVGERETGEDSRPLSTYRRGPEADGAGSTLEGEVLGTPAYMSPEQAHGDLTALGPHSDVYSFGAMLYHLLSGHPPYLGPDDRAHGHTVWLRLREGPPTPLERAAPAAPPELAAICEAAMARAVEDRIPDFAAVGDQLRAFLEGRTVASYRTGTWVELVKWVQRNRATAAALLAFVLALVGAAVVYALGERRRFEARVPDIAGSLIREAERSWPAEPGSVAAIEAFVERAEELRSRWDGQPGEPPPLTEEEAALRQGFESFLAGGGALDPDDVSTVELEIALLDDVVRRVRSAEPPTSADGIDAQLDWLYAPGWGAVARADRRAQHLREVERLSLVHHADDWDAAIESIRDRNRCPAYGGLAVVPQWGLVPLARNPETRLWEFWHVASGERPEPDGRGGWVVGPETGIVLVLLPAGSFRAWCHDRERMPAWFPHPESVAVEPFLVSKYETTQGQWWRATHTTPSERPAGTSWLDDPRITRAHPVENVSWVECAAALASLGLVLPTEMQWEYAARAGSNDLLWGPATLDPARVNEWDWSYDEILFGTRSSGRYDDGWPFHAPVDSFAPNPFGLHHAVGNVSELCRDVWCSPLSEARFEGPEGRLRGPNQFLYRASRGGSFKSTNLTTGWREQIRPAAIEETVGVRAARRLDAPPATR